MRWLARVTVVLAIAGPAVDMFSAPALVALALMLALPAAVVFAPGEAAHGYEQA